MDDTQHSALYSIGEFSRISGITVKALRFYHEEGLLPPAVIDADSGYRYYRPEQLETARAIRVLRDLELPIGDIRALLRERDSRERLIEVLTRQQAALEERIRKHKESVRMLQEFLAAERRSEAMPESTPIVEEKIIPPMLVAGIRMKGRYSDCGKAFGKLYRAARSAAGGAPLMLHYDQEYKENDADFEACIPLRRQRTVAGADVRELPAAKCVCYLHKGPYEQLHTAYAAVFKDLKEKGYQPAAPCREIYIKGPGMIFRGNPKNYITEVQVPITA